MRVLSRLFRRLFLDRLQRAFDLGRLQFFTSLAPLVDPSAFARYLHAPRHAEWVVYAKEPFGGPQQVFEYLGRYTHRVAISNNRLLSMTDGHVTFRWKDYRREAAQRVMQLDAHEFIRRFLLHVLPRGLQRIRHYGLLGNRWRVTRLAECRRLLGASAQSEAPAECARDYRDHYASLTGQSLRDCPACARGHMVCIELIPPHARQRAPPGGAA